VASSKQSKQIWPRRAERTTRVQRPPRSRPSSSSKIRSRPFKRLRPGEADIQHLETTRWRLSTFASIMLEGAPCREVREVGPGSGRQDILSDGAPLPGPQHRQVSQVFDAEPTRKATLHRLRPRPEIGTRKIASSGSSARSCPRWRRTTRSSGPDNNDAKRNYCAEPQALSLERAIAVIAPR
jgi:hypothetical protein